MRRSLYQRIVSLAVITTGLMLLTVSVWAADLSRADVENVVRRSYQYVALGVLTNNRAAAGTKPPAAV